MRERGTECARAGCAREAAAETLREAALDGRLDFAELDERLKVVYGTKTHLTRAGKK
jgi:hypothetical protein